MSHDQYHDKKCPGKETSNVFSREPEREGAREDKMAGTVQGMALLA
jgi:hypothetical protein